MGLLQDAPLPRPDAQRDAVVDHEEQMRRVGQRIRQAIVDGKMTKEEGRERMESYRRRLEASDSAGSDERVRDVQKSERKQRGQRGDQAERKQRGQRGEQAERKQRGQRGDQAEGKDRGHRGDQAERKQRGQRSGGRCDACGRGGQQRAERGPRSQRMDAPRKEWGQVQKKQGNRAQPDWGRIKVRVEGGVKSGKITREQANEIYKKFKTGQKDSARQGGRRQR